MISKTAGAILLFLSLAPPLEAVTVQAEVVSVYDGDTFKVEAMIWPGQVWRGSVRVVGVDTPEIRGKCISEKAGALRARDFVRAIIGQEVTLIGVANGLYAGRVIAKVQLSDGSDLAEVLIKKGLGRSYDGGTRQGWCGKQ